MRHGKSVRGMCAALASAALLLGCGPGPSADGPAPATPGTTEDTPPPAGAAGDGTVPLPGGVPAPATDGLRTPRSAAEAREVVRAVAVAPEDFGSGFRPQDPYEADPDTWAVLGDDCVWLREPLPPQVLAGLTRYVESPAVTEGGGPLQVMYSITVHDGEDSADARMADILEEVLRCPEQQLRSDERVTSLTSAGTSGDHPAMDDLIDERGLFHSDLHGGPYAYQWLVSRAGPVIVALSVKGSADHPDHAALREVSGPVLTLMQAAIEKELR